MTNEQKWEHRCLVVPDQYVALARKLTSAIAGESGFNMWTTALSNDGNIPATFWISAGMITAEFAAILPCTDIGFTGNSAVTAYLANKKGVVVTQKEVQDLFDNSECTTEESIAALKRLNLKLIEFI